MTAPCGAVSSGQTHATKTRRFSNGDGYQSDRDTFFGTRRRSRRAERASDGARALRRSWSKFYSRTTHSIKGTGYGLGIEKVPPGVAANLKVNNESAAEAAARAQRKL
jgi:hypothetical protein